jgi:hypothetical protein
MEQGGYPPMPIPLVPLAKNGWNKEGGGRRGYPPGRFEDRSIADGKFFRYPGYFTASSLYSVFYFFPPQAAKVF